MRSASGQASLEYVAALALVAAALVLAAPAVGAPDIGGLVVSKLRLALCVVASDICSDDDAREAGAAPCPLRTDTTGWDAFVSVFSIEVGGRWTLTVTRRSDGSVSVVRTAGAHKGASLGVGLSTAGGTVVFDIGVSGSVRRRFQAARAWEFPDAAAAARFLERPLRNAVDEGRWPASWHSIEKADELAGLVGATARRPGGRAGVQTLGILAGWQEADGARIGRDGTVTLYSRTALDGPDIAAPFLPPSGRGRQEWVVEYTYDRGGPRELVFRNVAPGARARHVVETAMRLDLRDRANLEAARPLLARRLPWPPGDGPRKRAVLARIGSHGVVERAEFALEDVTRGVSGSVRGGPKFGAGVRRLATHRRLVDAAVRTGGRERERYDCVRRR